MRYYAFEVLGSDGPKGYLDERNLLVVDLQKAKVVPESEVAHWRVNLVDVNWVAVKLVPGAPTVTRRVATPEDLKVATIKSLFWAPWNPARQTWHTPDNGDSASLEGASLFNTANDAYRAPGGYIYPFPVIVESRPSDKVWVRIDGR